MQRTASLPSLVALLALCAGATSCQNFQKSAAKPTPAPATQKPPATVQISYWDGEGVQGTPSIEINLAEQCAYFYKDDSLVGLSKISTGKKGFETPPGSYKVVQKNKDHVSNLYGDYVDADGSVIKRNVDVTKDPMPEGATFKGAKMPYFLRFTGGYGMHAGRVPNYRASHGCVRMPAFMAEHFFKNSEVGTPVVVKD